MPASAATAAERAPRRARYLFAGDAPRRGEIAAACGMAVLAAHAAFAQLTIVLAVGLYAVGKVTRWRPVWLAGPAGAGLIWAVAIGPARAVAGLTAGPRQVAAYLGGIPGTPGRLLHLGAAFSGPGHWLPGQLPLALVLAAAEVAVLRPAGWLHPDRQPAAPARPGLIVAARRRYWAATVRSGGVVTRAGGCLGIDRESGGLAAVSWLEAEGGVLAAGAAAAPAGYGPAGTSFQLVHAAIRRRKPVIVVDLTGSRWLAGSLAAVCAAAGAPFCQFGEAGRRCYEPLRGDPARAAALVLGMIDWSAATAQQRRTCAAYLGDVFAVLAAAPGDPRRPVLDDVLRLLGPAALRTRLGRLPGQHPQRGALADRVAVSAGLVEADPAALRVLASQLSALRSSAAGRWLCPGGERISLGQVLRERAVCLFPLDHARPGPSASMIAGLVACDAMALFAELRGIPVSGDGLVWLNGCEPADRQAVAELAARGGQAGMTVLLSTTSDRAAASLAADVNVIAIHRLADPAAAGLLAAQAGPGSAGPAASGGIGHGGRAVPEWAQRMPVPAAAGSPAAGAAAAAGPGGADPLTKAGRPAVTAEALLRLPAGAFALLVKGPERRLLPQCQSVPARIPGGRP